MLLSLDQHSIGQSNKFAKYTHPIMTNIRGDE